MSKSRFGDLAQRLLAAGISPKFALRLEKELETHFAELRASALSRQESPEDATAEALARLGDPESIAAGFFERPELQLWIYKWPWSTAATLVVGALYLVLWPILLAANKRTSIARFSGAAVLSVGMTLALYLVMISLISSSGFSPDASDTRRRTVNFNVSRILPDQEQPRVNQDRTSSTESSELLNARNPRPGNIGPLVSMEEWRDVSDNFDIGHHSLLIAVDSDTVDIGFETVDSDYMAVLKVAPAYPALALRRGLEGYVIVEFTITRAGTVKDILVVESSSRIFENGSTEAVSKFRYRPRIHFGEPLDVLQVRNKITFELEA